MENSDAELKGFSATKKSENTLQLLTPDVTVNQLFYVNPHPDGFIPNCCSGSDHFCEKIPCAAKQVKQGFKQPVCAAQHKGLKQHGEPQNRGVTPARMNFYPVDTRQECCCWKCGPNQCGTAQPENRGASRSEDKYSCQLLNDKEYLESPLPLRSDEDWQHYNPFVPPHYYMYNYVNRYPPQPCHHAAPCQHRRPCEEPPNWFRCNGNAMNDSPQGSVSVNVPQFVIPPVEGMSRVSVMNLSSPGAEVSVSCPHEQSRAISLPDECKNVFVTYSSDISSEIVPFVDFLTKQGFQPTTDFIDDPVRHVDISKWKDRFLLDPSALIIIAISPKYKADIERSVVDGHSLYTRYIYTMMQNEFIQQGSLNFRFIPVLFLNASQKHVPSWLQNTHVYRWPQDTGDLLLRLFREEKYVPPPVPVELTLIIRPVASSSTATL